MMYKQANRRFLTVMMSAMALFLLFSLLIDWSNRNLELAAPILWAASLVPIAALLTTLWAHWRFVTEIDEFLRSIQIKAIFVGLAVIRILVSSWGYLERYVDAPTLPMFWLNPIYWIAYSCAAMVFSRREGAPL